jgi:hypothetical protein
MNCYINLIGFVILKTKKEIYFAESYTSFIKRNSIKGILIDYTLHKNYNSISESVVEVLYKTIPNPNLNEIIEIEWPYSPVKALSIKEWNAMLKDKKELMITQESRVVNNILGYLKTNIPKTGSIFEFGFSHGFLLKKIKECFPSIKIGGIEASQKHIENIKEENIVDSCYLTPEFLESDIQVEYFISRAFAHFVFTKSEAVTLLSDLVNKMKTKGTMIFHSTSPSVLSLNDLEKYGDIVNTVLVREDVIAPFYVLIKN